MATHIPSCAVATPVPRMFAAHVFNRAKTALVAIRNFTTKWKHHHAPMQHGHPRPIQGEDSVAALAKSARSRRGGRCQPVVVLPVFVGKLYSMVGAGGAPPGPFK